MRGFSTLAAITAGFLLLAMLATPAFAVTKPATTWYPAHSSNYTASNREVSYNIDRVVIHTVQGSYSGCISWFQNPSSNVSAHYVISETGQIAHMVDDTDIAWHAGSTNSRSIGIEHEGYVSGTYETAQYEASAQLTAWLCQAYAIPADRTHIIGHSEAPGATHTDPGANWDWTYFMSRVNFHLGVGSTWDSSLSSATYPSTMTPGGSDVCYLYVNNTGNTTWTNANTTMVRTPVGQPGAFYTPGNWVDTTTPTRLDVPSSCGPGTVGTFAWVLTAPTVTTATTYTETFRLSDTGSGGVFGATFTVAILVDPGTGAALQITTASLPDGREQASYGPASITATGGTLPYAFSIGVSGLPAGLALAADGTVSGTPDPATAGTYNVDVRVTDGTGATIDDVVTIFINQATPSTGPGGSCGATVGGASAWNMLGLLMLLALAIALPIRWRR